jgi:hypothetical protein
MFVRRAGSLSWFSSEHGKGRRASRYDPRGSNAVPKFETLRDQHADVTRYVGRHVCPSDAQAAPEHARWVSSRPPKKKTLREHVA